MRKRRKMSKNSLKAQIKEDMQTGEMRTYDHLQNLNQMMKCVWMAPVGTRVKIFKVRRLWGASPLFCAPMTHAQAAADILGRRAKPNELAGFILAELWATKEIKAFMRSESLQGIINKFNEKYEKYKAEMFAKHSFDNAKFTI